MRIILGKEYIMSDLGLTEVDAAEKVSDILSNFNRVLGADQYAIVNNGIGHHLRVQSIC